MRFNNNFQQYLQETTGSPTGEPGNLFIRTLTTEVAESTIIGNLKFSIYHSFGILPTIDYRRTQYYMIY